MFDLNGYWNEFGGNNGKYFSRNFMLQIGNEDYDSKYRSFCSNYNNKDIYKCVYSYETREIDKCKLYAPLYFDLDGDINTEKGFEQIKKDVLGIYVRLSSLGLRNDEINLYFSGSKGFHITVEPEVLGIEPDEKLNLLYKAWAIHMYETCGIHSIDLGIYDRRRLFRIPGSINGKTGLYKVKLTLPFLRKARFSEIKSFAGNYFNSIEEPRTWNINEEAAINFYDYSSPFFETPKEPERTIIEIPSEKIPLLPCVEELLQSSVFQGSRNNMAVMLASGIMQSGYSHEETLDLVHDWNSNNNPPLSEKEVEDTVRSAYGMLLLGRKYGCSAFKEYGYCVGSCKLEGK